MVVINVLDVFSGEELEVDLPNDNCLLSSLKERLCHSLRLNKGNMLIMCNNGQRLASDSVDLTPFAGVDNAQKEKLVLFDTKVIQQNKQPDSEPLGPLESGIVIPTFPQAPLLATHLHPEFVTMSNDNYIIGALVNYCHEFFKRQQTADALHFGNIQRKAEIIKSIQKQITVRETIQLLSKSISLQADELLQNSINYHSEITAHNEWANSILDNFNKVLEELRGTELHQCLKNPSKPVNTLDAWLPPKVDQKSMKCVSDNEALNRKENETFQTIKNISNGLVSIYERPSEVEDNGQIVRLDSFGELNTLIELESQIVDDIGAASLEFKKRTGELIDYLKSNAPDIAMQAGYWFQVDKTQQEEMKKLKELSIKSSKLLEKCEASKRNTLKWFWLKIREILGYCDQLPSIANVQKILNEALVRQKGLFGSLSVIIEMPESYKILVREAERRIKWRTDMLEKRKVIASELENERQKEKEYRERVFEIISQRFGVMLLPEDIFEALSEIPAVTLVSTQNFDERLNLNDRENILHSFPDFISSAVPAILKTEALRTEILSQQSHITQQNSEITKLRTKIESLELTVTKLQDTERILGFETTQTKTQEIEEEKNASEKEKGSGEKKKPLPPVPVINNKSEGSGNVNNNAPNSPNANGGAVTMLIERIASLEKELQGYKANNTTKSPSTPPPQPSRTQAQQVHIDCPLEFSNKINMEPSSKPLLFVKKVTSRGMPYFRAHSESELSISIISTDDLYRRIPPKFLPDMFLGRIVEVVATGNVSAARDNFYELPLGSKWVIVNVEHVGIVSV
eukprot:TRINITY_DN5471_c1_g1_i1.p1 TRINITY_DN5471_c1_g1~~TRINITY_DN5471_c1_g1_i1.p1  ORF type:complete len:803 (+),score=180.94 TRINITY_DN5471_c1_g1_i1:190-2598(+)